MAEKVIEVIHSSDISVARQAAKTLALGIGFDNQGSEEIAIVVSELASNLVKHAKDGRLILKNLSDGKQVGIQVESHDTGPGINDIEQVITDGVSTTGSLGYGLGTVNRLMDTFDITSQCSTGTHIACQRWVRVKTPNMSRCPLDFGVASRAYPGMEVNGDTFVIKQWDKSTIVGVIDGLGHGLFAHHAAEAARQYVESHFDQPLDTLFRGVARTCHTTRGVVMALARFDWRLETNLEQNQKIEDLSLVSLHHNSQSLISLTFASVGNIEAHIFCNSKPLNLVVQRGVIGGYAPNAVVTTHFWDPHTVMVLHSDGLSSYWRWENFSDIADKSAAIIAQRLLQKFARDNDDATVIVIKGLQE